MSALVPIDLRPHYYGLSLPLAPLVQDIGVRGIPLDIRRRDAMYDALVQRCHMLERELFFSGIREPGSASKLAYDLVSKGVPLTKKTPKGSQYATDLEVLRRMHHNYNEANPDRPLFPFLKPLIAWKKLDKARTNIARLGVCCDGMLRTALRSYLTKTGRFSSRGFYKGKVPGWCPTCEEWGFHGTNLQNIPKPDKENVVNIRECFVARPGWVLIEADYKQLELRIMAVIAGVQLLLDRLDAGIDLHTEHCKAWFGGNYDDKLRTLTKNVFYGMQYGGGPKALQMALAKQGLFHSEEEIRVIMDNIFATYPGIGLWQADSAAALAAQEEAHLPRTGVTQFGRQRILLGRQPQKEKLSVEVQGTAAGLISFAILRMQRESPEVFNRLALQIHDSNFFHCPKDEALRVIEVAKEQMERPAWLQCGKVVSFPVDVKMGVRWSEMEEVAA